MSAKIYVTGMRVNEIVRNGILNHTTGPTVIVYNAPERFYITQVHDKFLDAMLVGEILRPVKYGPEKRGRGGKIKKW